MIESRPQLTKRWYCAAQLPRTGLGNMLFVWAKASVFASLNNLKLINSRWTQIKIGPVLRGERSWRFYRGYFKRNQSVHPIKAYWIRHTYPQVVEPPVKCLVKPTKGNCVYIFNQIPDWRDYFGDIREHREFIRLELNAMLNDKFRRQIEEQPVPCIAVHVRRGDFRELQASEDFAKVGLVRTPLSYFTQLIYNIRQMHGSQLPVTVFSDGQDHELGELLAMPGVNRASTAPDIVDLLVMSRSKMLITSAGSTFSYWAAFLSDAIVLLHPDHIYAPIRSTTVNNQFFEGGVRDNPDTWPDLLKNNIHCIQP